MSAVDVGNTTGDLGSLSVHNTLLDVVNSIIACLAVLGNGTVIIVMLCRRRVFSSFTNRLILHQSVIDCLTGVVFFVWRVVFQRVFKNVSFENNVHGQLMCRLICVDYLLWFLDVTSTYNLLVISLERFMATCHPIKHRNTWTKAKLKFAMGTAWVIGFVYGSHFLFMFEARQGRCQMAEIETVWRILETSAVFIIEYLVPIIIFIYTYSRILIKLSKKPARPMNGPQNIKSKAKKNVLVMTMLISLMFVACWTPIEVFYIWAFISGTWRSWLYTTFTSLLACNMFVNPIIYCFKYEHFRSELGKMITRRCRRNRVQDLDTIQKPVTLSRLNTNGKGPISALLI